MSTPGGARARAVAERSLRARVRPPAGLAIVTGGQTGVDTYAALAALRAGLPVHLVLPLGYRQEDGSLPAVRREELSGAFLHELSSPSFRYRTWTVVYIADAVIMLDPAGGAGCRETARAARALGRPLLSPRPGELTKRQTADWLAENDARVLTVAGCRGSLLAATGTEHSVLIGLDVLMSAASERHGQVRAQG